MSTVPKVFREPRSRRKLQTPVVLPLIAMVLGDETYYRDGPPTWPNAPTSEDARDARDRYVKRLRRFAAEFPEATALADILARCKRRHQCTSGACPECGRAFQRWFVSQVDTLIESEIAEDQSSISIIFSNHRTAEHQLTGLDTTGIKRSLSETIKDTDGLAWMVGGIDLSLNDDTQKKQGIAPGSPRFMPLRMPMSRSCRRACATLLLPPKYPAIQFRSKTVTALCWQFPTLSRPISSDASLTEQIQRRRRYVSSELPAGTIVPQIRFGASKASPGHVRLLAKTLSGFASTFDAYLVGLLLTARDQPDTTEAENIKARILDGGRTRTSLYNFDVWHLRGASCSVACHRQSLVVRDLPVWADADWKEHRNAPGGIRHRNTEHR